ncbi:hypothetical protein Taro_032739, partial [Colocasia esculenta]|nr:hypothetical protein [Colocasia esculenta]
QGCKLTCVTSLDRAWKGTLKGVHNWRSYALRRPLGCQAVYAPLNSGARVVQHSRISAPVRKHAAKELGDASFGVSTIVKICMYE